MRPVLTTIGIGAAAVAVAIAGAGAAEAAPAQSLAPYCIGLSPNIIDIPYSGDMRVSPAGAGAIHVQWSNPSLIGYTTKGRLSWKNLRTGAADHVVADFQHNLSGYGFSTTIHPGAGPVRLTTSGINSGMVTLGAPTCSGITTVN